MPNYRLKAPKRIEKNVGGAYQKIEGAVVGAYQKIEDKFVRTFLEEVPPEDSARGAD